MRSHRATSRGRDCGREGEPAPAARAGTPHRPRPAGTPPASPASSTTTSPRPGTPHRPVPAGTPPASPASSTTTSPRPATTRPASPPSRPGARALWEGASPVWLAALACTAAAFTAVLFLLVIELVAGFALSPLRAALGVTVLPLAALAAAASPGDRAAAGARRSDPDRRRRGVARVPARAGIAWTIVPQLLAGAGMGLALPAFSDERNLKRGGAQPRRPPRRDRRRARDPRPGRHRPARRPRPSARSCRARRSCSTRRSTRCRSSSSRRDLLGNVDVDSPRAGLTTRGRAAKGRVRRRRRRLRPARRTPRRRRGRRRPGRLPHRLPDRRRARPARRRRSSRPPTAGRSPGSPRRWPSAAVAVYAVEHDAKAPAPVTLEDPCDERELPQAGGFAGAIQNEALRTLDQAACRTGTSREEFALALFDPDRARQFRTRARRRPAQRGRAALTPRGLGAGWTARRGERPVACEFDSG